MRQLVQHRNGAALTQRLSHLGPEDVRLKVGHAPGVFHCTSVELGNEQLIVLLKRVRGFELLLVELEPLAGQLEHVVGVYERHERLTGVHAQGDDAPLRVREFAGDFLVRASHDRRNVGGDTRGWLEIPGLCPAAPAVFRHDLHLGLVRNHHPRCGHPHDELELRFQIRLLKHGENTARVRYLKLRVQVHLPVHRVHKPVQALTGVGVEHVGVNHQYVLRGKVRQGNALPVG